MAQAPGWGDRCSRRALLVSGFLEPRENQACPVALVIWHQLS